MSNGYGICGHTNAYSSKVKVGNYVEDQFETDLSSTTESHCLNGTSESRNNYIDPSLMVDKSKDAPQINETENYILRSGLSYNLMFAHGANGPTDAMTTGPNPQFTTTNSLLFGKNPIQSKDLSDDKSILQKGKIINKNDISREILKSNARSKRETNSYITTNKSNNSLIRSSKT